MQLPAHLWVRRDPVRGFEPSGRPVLVWYETAYGSVACDGEDCEAAEYDAIELICHGDGS